MSPSYGIDFYRNEIEKRLECFATGLLSDKDVDIRTPSIISDDFGRQFETQNSLNIGDDVRRERSGECGEMNVWKGDTKLINLFEFLAEALITPYCMCLIKRDQC